MEPHDLLELRPEDGAGASGAADMIWDDEAGIGTIEDILNAAECAEHIDRSERAGFGARPSSRPSARSSSRTCATTAGS